MTAEPPLCIVGLGLIGGSLLRGQAPTRAVTGWSPSESTRQAAAAEGYRLAESLDAALAGAVTHDALVVLAAPISAFPSLLKTINTLAPTVRLTDVASVKNPVADQVAELAPRARYVGSHPMAGTQHSGWAAGSADLFAGAAWVTCLTDDSDLEVWAQVAAIALAAGSRVVPVEPQAHDDAVARISHLPHLLALALAQVGAAGGPLAMSLAASSFADGTRVAGTRPALIRAMCEANREALIGAMDESLGLLGVARGSLASTGALAKIANGGHAAREMFETRGQGLAEVSLFGDDLIDQLLAVGSSGGHVSALTVGPTGLKVTAWYPDDE